MDSFTSWPFYHQGKTPGTHWIGRGVGHRAGLDAVVKRKIPIRRQESKPDRPARSVVATPTEPSAAAATT
jgi:hypothetical protein